jgi:hypothetical protein
MPKRKDVIAGREAELVPAVKIVASTAQQVLFAQMLKTNIVDEFAAMAVDMFDEQTADMYTQTKIFSTATGLLKKAQDVFGLVAHDLNQDVRCAPSEQASIRFAAECVILARVLKIPKRNRHRYAMDAVSMNQVQTGNGIVTYESLLADLADEARKALAPDILMDRMIAHPAVTARDMMAAARSAHKLVLHSIGPTASTDDAVAEACAAALIALTLVWDLRLFWVLGGKAGLKERIRELKEKRTAAARAAKTEFLATKHPTRSEVEAGINAERNGLPAVDPQREV